MSANPAIRDAIDIQLIEDGAEKVIYISCKLGLSQPLALISAVGPILIMLDGSRSLDAIKDHFAQQSVKGEIIDRVLQVLDDNYYLASDRFFQKKQELYSEFRASKIRPAAHAGRIYPDSSEELNNYLKSILEAETVTKNTSKSRKLSALIAPHIDYRRGATGYAKAYQQLAQQKPDICVVIGTSHQAGKSLFQLSNKDFAAPNGTLRAHDEFIESLLKGYGEDRGLADELLHRQEHSLELQIPFLNYFCPKTKIVPILVNGFYSYLRNKSGPGSDSEYQDFVNTISETTRLFSEQGKHVAFIAGVDMAHVGQNFGDSFLLDQEILANIEAQDKIYLDSICELSSKKMFDHIASDLDQRRMCGFSTMHTVIDILTKLNKSYEVDLLDYRQAVDDKTQCLVSFAAMGIYEV